MLRKNILIQLRSIAKKPILFVINILGLSVGVAACMLCYLHIEYEQSYDKFHSNSERIYRVVTGDVPGGEGWVKVSAPMPVKLKAEIPEVEEFARITKITYNEKVTVDYEGNVFNEEHFYMADPSLLAMFDFPLIAGSRDIVIDDMNSVIISESMSKKIFGEEDPIGNTIKVDGQLDFTVTGVISDAPFNSHITFDFLINFENLERIFPGTSLTGNWGQFNYFSYVMLHSNGIEEVVEDKIRDLKVDLGRNEEMGLEDINLQRLRDIHFEANGGNMKPSYDIKYLYIYGAVSIAILLISLINFINLTIAGSTKRIKEVGVRKVVGARKSQLVLQYISESFFISSVSIITAILIMKWVFLQTTNEIFDSNIVIDLAKPSFILSMLCLIIFISFSSGFYISVFVTSFQPIDVLKGTFKLGKKGSGLKNMLLGAQFVISISMILGSLFIYKQLNFMRGKDLGLDPEQVVSISLYNKDARAKAKLVKNEMLNMAEVESASVGRFTVGKANWNQTVWWEGQVEGESMSIIIVDNDFIKTMGLKIIEGEKQKIEQELNKGEFRYILNESALDMIGWDDAVGKSFSAFGGSNKAAIVGVVEDFNYRSLHTAIDPVVLAYYDGAKSSELLLKITSNNYSGVMEALKGKFNTVLPDTPFEYHFLDQNFEQLYNAENRTAKIVGLLTGLAIMLALLGLYGLLSFAIIERTKEIAIRKILGINLLDTLLLLSKGYARLLLFANLIAIPIVWFGVNQWLTNFSYRIDMHIFEFVGASLLVWIFLALTISVSSVHVNKIDVVSGLRYE